MTAPALPLQRAQVIPCPTCAAPLRSLLADCVNGACLAAAIDYLVREDERCEASDDE